MGFGSHSPFFSSLLQSAGRSSSQDLLRPSGGLDRLGQFIGQDAILALRLAVGENPFPENPVPDRVIARPVLACLRTRPGRWAERDMECWVLLARCRATLARGCGCHFSLVSRGYLVVFKMVRVVRFVVSWLEWSWLTGIQDLRVLLPAGTGDALANLRPGDSSIRWLQKSSLRRYLRFLFISLFTPPGKVKPNFVADGAPAAELRWVSATLWSAGVSDSLSGTSE